MKYLSILLFAIVWTAPLTAQDDDFFLRDEEEELTESSLLQESPADNLTGYYDDVVQRTLVEQTRVLEYEPLRELDVLWEKRIWRIIDTREKMNLGFRHPEKPFFSILKDLAENGDIRVFRDERFREPLGISDLGNILNRVDTTVVYDPETYEEQIKITQNPIDPEAITRYRVKEVWFFDKKTSQVKVRILGIAPVKDEYDESTGEFKYSIPLFWTYYPKARYFLAKERVYNDFNDIAPMSWHDLFESRFFASYIYKASNKLDLRLQDMYPNSDYDVLLESDKIKQELFNWEHDLWTY